MTANTHIYPIWLRNVSDKMCTVNQNKHITFNNFVFENRAFYETVWKNTAEPGRPQMTTWCMRIACWIPKATNRQSENVMFIGFPPQQWLHECAPVYVNCLSCMECICGLIYRTDFRVRITACTNTSTGVLPLFLGQIRIFKTSKTIVNLGQSSALTYLPGTSLAWQKSKI